MCKKQPCRKRKASQTLQTVRTGLARTDEEEYLRLLLRGASPAAAAQQLELDLFVIVEAIADDEEFRVKVDAAYDALSQNVAARLYQEAMRGSVPAMTLWLKNRPPPEWPDGRPEETFNPALDVLSDEELLRLARLENVEIPPELETGIDQAGGQ